MAQKGAAIALGVIIIVGLIAAVVPFPCSRCGGRGFITSQVTCATCGGDGKVAWGLLTCPDCGGTGYKTVQTTCPACHGRGTATLLEVLLGR